MKSIINGLTVYLNGNEKNQPIIFVHAFPHDNRMWKKQVDFFSKYYFVITYDIRGFGESWQINGQFTMEMFADDLLAIVNGLYLKKPIVAGLSMGGYIILRTLQKNINLFSAVVLCDTRPEADDNAGKLKRSNAIYDIHNNGVERYSEEFVKNCLWDENIKINQELLENAVQIVTSQSEIGVKGALLAMLSRLDLTEFLSKITIPTLVLCGEHDKITPIELMEGMANKIPNSKFVVVPNSGHMSNMENPNFVNQTILSFLEENHL